jgi:hypothetical protein
MLRKLVLTSRNGRQITAGHSAAPCRRSSVKASARASNRGHLRQLLVVWRQRASQMVTLRVLLVSGLVGRATGGQPGRELADLLAQLLDG